MRHPVVDRGQTVSERQEKKRRYNLRLMWIAEFDKWLNREPPMWRVFAWRKWKAERPKWTECEELTGVEL